MHARLIDFEQAFLHTVQSLAKVRTPLVFRAPETLLDSKWDLRIDIRSLACMFSELVTEQPPFDNSMPTMTCLVQDWIGMFGDVPKKWRKEAMVVVGDWKDEIDRGSPSGWPHGTYFNGKER